MRYCRHRQTGWRQGQALVRSRASKREESGQMRHEWQRYLRI